MKHITVKEVEHLAYVLAKKHMEWDEPIPDFATRYSGVLESCLANAYQTYGGRELYPTLIDKAAMIFYQMIKNHPFLNGNKRIAITTLWVFAYFNNRWFAASDEQVYQLAVFVAGSNPKVKAEVVKIIKEFLKEHETSASS